MDRLREDIIREAYERTNKRYGGSMLPGQPDAHPTGRVIDDTEALAEAWEAAEKKARYTHTRMNHLLVQRPLPALAAVPQWLAGAEGGLEAAGANKVMLERADKLVRAVIAVAKESPDGCLELDELGRIVIEWKLKDGVLVWALEPTDLSWPNVKVLSLLMRPEADGEVRYFNNAFTATDYYCCLYNKE